MQRKHRHQMSREEISFTEALLHDITDTVGWRVAGNKHLIDEAKRDRISKQDMLEALRKGRLIDISDCGRALLRSMSGTCIVVNFIEKKLVTVWYNSPDDQHFAWNRSHYSWQVNVVDFIKSKLGGNNGRRTEQEAVQQSRVQQTAVN